MNTEFKLSLVCLMVLFTCTKELPVDISSDVFTTETDLDKESKITSIPENSESFEKDNFNERWNHSRMLKISTTMGYDEWWYYTTRKPQIFFKDFPGKPGVATWKEISPGADNRQSRKIATPTASGVSSSSTSLKLAITSHLVNLFTGYGIVLSLLNFQFS